MFFIALFTAGCIVGMLLPVPKPPSPDVAELLAQIVKAVGRKL